MLIGLMPGETLFIIGDVIKDIINNPRSVYRVVLDSMFEHHMYSSA